MSTIYIEIILILSNLLNSSLGLLRFLRKQADEEALERKKREKKAAEVQLLEAANDPFGGELIDPAAIAKAERAKQLDDDDD